MPNGHKKTHWVTTVRPRHTARSHNQVPAGGKENQFVLHSSLKVQISTVPTAKVVIRLPAKVASVSRACPVHSVVDVSAAIMYRDLCVINGTGLKTCDQYTNMMRMLMIYDKVVIMWNS